MNDDGTLDILDQRTGAAVRNTHYLVQEADLGGGYHFEPLPGDVRRDTRSTPAKTKLLSSGPLRGCLEVTTKLSVPRAFDRRTRRRTGRAVIRVRMRLTLEPDTDLLHVATEIANTAGNQRLRLVLPTGMRTTTVAADASFAVHENGPDRWPSEPRQGSHPMRSFLSIAEDGVGFSFLGKGLHEYEIVPGPAGTDLEVTLLRSVDFVFMCCTWETPDAQLRRELRYEYALKLHSGDWRAGNVPASAAAFRHSAVAEVHGDLGNPKEDEAHATIAYTMLDRGTEVPVDPNRSAWKAYHAHRDGWRRVEPGRYVRTPVPDRLRPFTIEGKHVVISAFKCAQDGRGEVLRFSSYAATEQTVTVSATGPTATIGRTDLLERDQATDEDHQRRIALTVRPFEIVTLRIWDGD